MANKTIGDRVVDGVLGYMAKNPNLTIVNACENWSKLPESDEFGMWYRLISTDKARKYLYLRIAKRLQKAGK